MNEVAASVVVAIAILLASAIVRGTGRWLARAIAREFKETVLALTSEELKSVRSSIEAVRTEQRDQHATMRGEVNSLREDVKAWHAYTHERINVLDHRLKKIEQRPEGDPE